MKKKGKKNFIRIKSKRRKEKEKNKEIKLYLFFHATANTRARISNNKRSPPTMIPINNCILNG